MVYISLFTLANVTTNANLAIYGNSCYISVCTVNSIFQYRNNCSNTSGIILGGVIGLLVLGGSGFGIGSGHKDLLFYNELVSNTICTSF